LKKFIYKHNIFPFLSYLIIEICILFCKEEYFKMAIYIPAHIFWDVTSHSISFKSDETVNDFIFNPEILYISSTAFFVFLGRLYLIVTIPLPALYKAEKIFAFSLMLISFFTETEGKINGLLSICHVTALAINGIRKKVIKPIIILLLIKKSPFLKKFILLKIFKVNKKLISTLSEANRLNLKLNF